MERLLRIQLTAKMRKLLTYNVGTTQPPQVLSTYVKQHLDV